MKLSRAFVAVVLIPWLQLGARAASSPAFDSWADEFAAEWVRTNPQFATRVQYFTGSAQDDMDRQLGLVGVYGNLYGVKAAEARAALAHRGLAALDRFDPASLSPQQRTSAAVIRWTLNDAIASAKFAPYHFVFEQFGGLHIALVNFLASTHPIRNRRDIENYLARLSLIGARLDEGIAEAKTAADAGIIPPRFVIERVIEQLDSMLATRPADNPLVKTFNTRITALGAAISWPDQTQFVAAAEKMVRETVLPALQRVKVLMEEQRSKSTDDAGIWRLPGGDAAYRAALASSTTTTLTPAEVDALGERETARIEAEMDGILKQLGYSEGSVAKRFDQLSAALPIPPGPDPRPALLQKIAAVVHDAERRSASVFDVIPTAPVTVRREPAFSEKSAAAHYSDPAPDGSRPGVYWVPMADVSPTVTWLGAGLKTTAYHEAVPGHHFQLSIQQESKELPRYRKLGVFGMNSAFIEGWALYAERLADENGWYDGDPVGRLGFLDGQRFRAHRLVADTGIHARRWTRQQVIDYGFTAAEAERYVVWPGQACSYMIGQLKILELRDRARTELGPRFSIKAFHDLILGGGTLPLDVLEQEVNAWIATEKSVTK